MENLEWAVLPIGISNDDIPLEATVKITSPFDLIATEITLHIGRKFCLDYHSCYL